MLLINFFTRPFPYTDNLQKKFFSALFISLFVLFFLFIFKPFGMDNLNNNVLLICSGYGVVTFVITMLSNFLIPRLFPSVFKEESWTVLKEIIYIQLIVLLVAVGNLLFSYWLGYVDISLNMFYNSVLITLAVAVIPVSVLILFKQNILLKRNLREAKELSDNLYLKKRLLAHEGETVTIQSENPKDNLVLEVNSIHFVSSADNYVEVVYTFNNNITRKLLRTTLRNVQTNLRNFSQYYRCHRAYIVNLEKVKKVTGNAQGYRLIIQDVDELIPVSRSMTKEINLRLRR